MHTCFEMALVFVVSNCYDTLAKGGYMCCALIVRATKKVLPATPHPLLLVYAALQLRHVWCNIHPYILPTKYCHLGFGVAEPQLMVIPW